MLQLQWLHLKFQLGSARFASHQTVNRWGDMGTWWPSVPKGLSIAALCERHYQAAAQISVMDQGQGRTPRRIVCGWSPDNRGQLDFDGLVRLMLDPDDQVCSVDSPSMSLAELFALGHRLVVQS